ncbi:hypothetical protein STRCI_002651 [Streptomyces cinnabarinus]|uniref:Zinc ribbon domain-containing protein n=1 Tax=Streptomyces cinnabarinus TaxID=67287 RepID=A0ABY7KDN9_9ACTN|nr:hypothetical protein [Streptomyces cinnabarinus]WAZ21477.1 hypothetical protein STRCI_002651 [Streptomyces cinnabarinus]
MDYCHPCRRHLNGALACPGCGAPVEQLRVYASEEASRTDPYDTYDEPEGAPEPVAVGATAEAARPEGRAAARRAARGRRGRVEQAYEPEGDEDGYEDEAPEVTGASRRDRKAAAHRRRRRRTILIAAGFVLAAGGLSLAELGLDAPGSTPTPAAAGDASPDGGAESEAGESAEPIGDTPGTPVSASPTASASPSPSKSEKDKESEKPEDKPTKDAQSATGGALPVTPDAPEPTEADPKPTPTAEPTEEEPKPEPSETCTRFLWWCS